LESFATLVSTIGDFTKEIGKLDKALNHHAEGEPYDHAKHAREHIFTALGSLREVGDKLETMVADDLWPLPTYREMLFIK
jgi:glutamine synthetase